MNILVGDIFQSETQTLVNTVNCVGVMGKGIAAEFKNDFLKCLEIMLLVVNEKRSSPEFLIYLKSLCSPSNY